MESYIKLSGYIKIYLDDNIVYESKNTFTSAGLQYVRNALSIGGTFNPIIRMRLTYSGTSTSNKVPTISNIGNSAFIASATWAASDGALLTITRISLRNNSDEISYAAIPSFDKTLSQNLTIEWTVSVT